MKKINRIAACLLGIVLMFTAGPLSALAANPVTPVPPSETLEVYVRVNGEDTLVHTYTTEEMSAMAVSGVNYSGIDAGGFSTLTTVSSGVYIDTLVADVSSRYGAALDYEKIYFTATDRASANFSYEKLHEERYYFPGMFDEEVWDLQYREIKSEYWDQVLDGKVLVKPMLAISSFQERIPVTPTEERTYEPEQFTLVFGMTEEELEYGINTVSSGYKRGLCQIKIDLGTITTPTEPTEPTEPTGPTGPTEPTEPTEPTKPTEPTVPGESVGKVFGTVTGVTLNYRQLSLSKGDSCTLRATVSPETAENTEVYWGSSAPSVVSVDTQGNLTCRNNGTATITVSTADGGFTAQCTVTVTDTPVLFDDVPAGHWAYEAVSYAVKAGLFYGTGENTFSPSVAMTRGMLVTVLYRMAHSPAVSGSCPFTDVKAGSYYSDAVLWAWQNDIVNGVASGSFAPDSPVTREQLTTILFRYVGAQAAAGEAVLDKFSDRGEIGGYAVPAMCWAVDGGLISGKTADTLCPAEQATRAEVAAVLMRAVQNGIIADEEEIP